jgi:hypothetical protein
VVVLPPLLVAELLEADLSDPLALIPELTLKAAQFDDNHAGVASVRASAKEVMGKLFLRWLWLVGKGEIDGLEVKIDEEDDELKAYLLEVTSKHILPPTGTQGNTPPDQALNVLIPVLSKMNENLELHAEIQAKGQRDRELREEKKKDRTKDFHESFIHIMMLMASSPDGEMAAEELTPFAMKFFNSKTVGFADQTLLNHFQSNGIEDAGFAEGVTNALYNGQFIWHNSTNPKNASVFSFFINAPDDSTQASRSLVMHLQDNNKNVKTDAEVRNSTKQYIMAPTSYDKLLKHMNMFVVFLKGFLGEESDPFQAWKGARDKVIEEVSSFKGHSALWIPSSLRPSCISWTRETMSS